MVFISPPVHMFKYLKCPENVCFSIFIFTAAQLWSFNLANIPRCAYRFGSFNLTPTLGALQHLTASGMHFPVSLVHLFDGWSRGSSTRWRSSTSGESTRHPTRHPSCALVQLSDDGVAHLLQLLLLVLKLLLLSRLEKTRAQSH